MSKPGKSVRPAQYFFPFTAPGAKAMPPSAKYSTLAAGIPFAIERLEYSPSIFAISRASEASGDCANALKLAAQIATGRNNFCVTDKFKSWRRLKSKDREGSWENVATHEDWKVCFSELAPGLVLFARQWVRSPADAEDVVQDAFVRFWRRNLSIKNRALLYAAVRSAALDLIRRDNRRARREVEVFGEAERTVQPQFEQLDDSQRELVAALDRLPRDQREVLVMKIWNELTFAEIAEALGISQNTAALPNYQATGLTQVVYSKRDEGLVFPPGAEGPSRRVRTARRETLQWRDRQTGAQLAVSYPTEEVTLTPVSGQ